jgi:hypothetical protein
MASRMCGRGLEISYIVGRCVREDAEGRVILRACVDEAYRCRDCELSECLTGDVDFMSIQQG